MDNKSLSHTRWKCQYHIVFIPKYRKKVLYGKVREDVREIISTLCKYKSVEIIAGAVCIDHVHLSVAIPPKLSVSDFMGYLKGKSTLMLYDRHPELQRKLLSITFKKFFFTYSSIRPKAFPTRCFYVFNSIFLCYYFPHLDHKRF